MTMRILSEFDDFKTSFAGESPYPFRVTSLGAKSNRVSE